MGLRGYRDRPGRLPHQPLSGSALTAFVPPQRAAVGLFALALLAGIGAAYDAPTRDLASGLELVGSNYQKRPLSEAHAGALSEAWELARRYPDALGYAGLDYASGELVLTATSDAGEKIAREWMPRHAEAGTVPRTVRRVTFSFAQLERIQHGSIGRGSGLPEGDAIIYQTAPDFDHNRVVITVDRLSATLLHALAARYGTDAIAIHLAPRRGYFGY